MPAGAAGLLAIIMLFIAAAAGRALSSPPGFEAVWTIMAELPVMMNLQPK